MTNFTPEMIQKAKSAKSVEALLEMSKQEGIPMTEEEAKAFFKQLNPPMGALDDDELDDVAGGGCGEPYLDPAWPYGFKEGTKVAQEGLTCSGCRRGRDLNKDHFYVVWGIIYDTTPEFTVSCSFCGTKRGTIFYGDPSKSGFYKI